jgi:N-acyl-D-aspartate/D-glutamate deacylase
MPAEFDLVVRNGTVADGFGSPLTKADVAVLDGRIAAVGIFEGVGREEIDATGLLVTPGFVDIHTHYDGQATWENRLIPSSWHGVTTVVMGNCGVGFAPVRRGDHQKLIDLMEGVEDIPGTALHVGLSWDWESFGDYLDHLDSRTFDVDVCTQIPHGPLRLYVMGDRAIRLEDATPQDSAQMRVIVRDAIRAGALGFSTSRSVRHKSITGNLIPSYRAGEDELTQIALGLRDAGEGVMEWVSDYAPESRDAEYEMIRRLVEVSGRPISVNIGEVYSNPEGWRETLRMVTRGHAKGLPILGQAAPRPVGHILGLSTSKPPFGHCPSYQAIADRPLAEQVAALRDADLRRAILGESAANPAGYAFSRIFAMDGYPDYASRPDRSISEIAAREGRTPDEVIYDLMLAEDGGNLLFHAMANFLDHTYDTLREMVSHPATVLGLGDGGAHVGTISDASFTTTALALWGRDWADREGTDLPSVIRRQTSATAAAVGLHDRGVIAPGMKADLNVIDMEALAAERPYVAHDLPSGAKRLLQRARGYEVTIVSGIATYKQGVSTGMLPGRLVRGSQAGPPRETRT